MCSIDQLIPSEVCKENQQQPEPCVGSRVMENNVLYTVSLPAQAGDREDRVQYGEWQNHSNILVAVCENINYM